MSLREKLNGTTLPKLSGRTYLLPKEKRLIAIIREARRYLFSISSNINDEQRKKVEAAIDKVAPWVADHMKTVSYEAAGLATVYIAARNANIPISWGELKSTADKKTAKFAWRLAVEYAEERGLRLLTTTQIDIALGGMREWLSRFGIEADMETETLVRKALRSLISAGKMMPASKASAIAVVSLLAANRGQTLPIYSVAKPAKWHHVINTLRFVVETDNDVRAYEAAKVFFSRGSVRIKDPVKVALRCRRCGHEWTMELRRRRGDSSIIAAIGYAIRLSQCPKCGARNLRIVDVEPLLPSSSSSSSS